MMSAQRLELSLVHSVNARLLHTCYVLGLSRAENEQGACPCGVYVLVGDDGQEAVNNRY